MSEATTNRPFQIWHYRDAPNDWPALSENGGDEDWIAFVPSGFPYGEPLFVGEGSTFGCCTVERHEVEGGVVLIGCHA
jgi:hypothetical protein